jgi:outer membrane protein assembly factor BamA
MPLDPRDWIEAPANEDDRPNPPTVPERRWDVQSYSPWRTLLPRRTSVQITQGAFGQAAILSATSSDVTGIHTVSASTTVEFEHPEIQGALGYTYARLPFDFGVSVFRSIAPRTGIAIGDYKPTVIQETAGFASTVAYTIPRAFDTSSFVLTHSISRVAVDLPLPADKLDPYDTPNIPATGFASNVHLGYSFTNAENYLFGVGPEGGVSFNVAVDFTHPDLGSDFEGFVADADFTTYFRMPWLAHHTLAAHVGGGTSGGSFPGRGAFFVGSFVDLPIVDTVQNILIQGGLVLRGYQPVVESGRSYLLSNLEYRFPIWNVDRGVETLPLFMSRINGAFFVDYGSAFDDVESVQFKTGVGGELWFDFTLGYIEDFTFRLGYARGLASGGIDKTYFVAAVPF